MIASVEQPQEAPAEVASRAKLALAVGVILFGLAVLVGASAELTGWDTALVKMHSPLPQAAPEVALAIIAAIAAALVFMGLLTWLNGLANRHDLSSETVQMLEDVVRIADQRTGVFLAGSLIFASAVAATSAVLHNGVNAWFWCGPLLLSIALIASSLSPGKRKPRAGSQTTIGVEVTQLPSAEDWWSALVQGPFYHGQVRGERTLSGRSGIAGASFLAEAREALKAADGEEYGPLCVLDLPKDAGLRSLITEIAITQALESRQRTLIIADSQSRFRSLRSRLQADIASDARRSSTIRASFVQHVDDLAKVGALQYEDLPHILLINAQCLDTVLRGALKVPWLEFFRALGLVVLNGALELQSAKSHHVALMLRRLELICDTLGARPALLVDCPRAQEQVAYLAKLLGRRRVERRDIVRDEKTARLPVNILVWVPGLHVTFDPKPATSRRSFLEEAEYLAANAIGQGLRVVVVVPDPHIADIDLTTARSSIEAMAARGTGELAVVAAIDDLDEGPQDWDIVIYAGLPPTVAELESDVSLLGARRRAEEKFVLLVAPHEPSALAFLNRLTDERASPSPALGMSNQQIAALHLRALIGSGAFEQDQLTPFRDLAEVMQQWVRDGQIKIDDSVRLGAYTPIEDGDDFCNPRIDTSAAGEALVSFVQAATNKTLDQVDISKALRIAYPAAVLVIERTRYQVQQHLNNSPNLFVVSPMGTQDVVTYPLVETSFDSGLLEPTIDVTRDRLTVQLRRLSVQEEIWGYRHASLSNPGEASTSIRFNAGPLKPPAFETTALVLSIDGSTRRGLHALAHVFKTAARLHLRYGSDEVGISVIDECQWLGGKPALVIYDNVLGALGIAEELAALVMDTTGGPLRTALDLLMYCPCSEGCPACLLDPACPEGFDLAALDKLEAISLLGAVLGQSETNEAIRRRTEPIDDVSYLVHIANRIVNEVFRPMLGLEIPSLPTIIPTSHLPDGVLGRYKTDENLIQIMPAREQLATSVLAHELAHAWSFQGGFSAAMFDEDIVLHPRLFVEGFAQWVESKVLDYFGFQFEVNEIANWVPDEYGIGFRLFAHLEEDPRIGGVGGVVRFVREPDRPWLAEYLTGAFRTEIGNLGKLADKPPDWEPPTNPAPPVQPAAPLTPEPIAVAEHEPIIEQAPAPAADAAETRSGVRAETGDTPDASSSADPATDDQSAAQEPQLAAPPDGGATVPDLTVRPRTRRSRRRSSS